MRRGNATNARAIRQLLDDLARRRERGEFVPDHEVVAAHPDLMPDLGEALATARTIRRARLEAETAGPVSRSLSPLDSADLDAPLDLGSDSRDGDPAPPPVIRGYAVVREVSSGGQAVVFEAVQESTGRRVAVKVIPGGRFTSSRQRERFEREVAILAALDHPYVVSILDRGRTADGSFYLAMPFIPGVALDDYVARRRQSPEGWREIIVLFARLAGAVGEAHRKGVTHRDLKPSNVRVDDRGDPHVLDFGLARLTGAGEWEARAVTATGQVVGSLPWASPEQAAGTKGIGPPSDVYSLGVMLYEALTGRFPYVVTGSMRQVMHNIAVAVPEPPSRTGRLPQGKGGTAVDAVVLQALAKSPAGRYPTAAELASDLEAIAGGYAVVAKRKRPFPRRRTLVFGLAVALVGSAGGVYRATRSSTVEVIPLPTLTNSLGMKLVRIPAGPFRMGGPRSEKGWDWTERDHDSAVTVPFYLSVTEVTRGQYRQVIGHLPDGLSDGSDDLPVSNVSYTDAVEFCRLLSEREGEAYRLPDETEWEYACRAGVTKTYSGTGRLDDMGWYAGNSGGHLHPVGKKSPNHWGLYDMHGGVAEWCADRYFADTPPGGDPPVFDLPRIPKRATRGGSIELPAEECRSAHRSGYFEAQPLPTLGFRIARAVDPT